MRLIETCKFNLGDNHAFVAALKDVEFHLKLAVRNIIPDLFRRRPAVSGQSSVPLFFGQRNVIFLTFKTLLAFDRQAMVAVRAPKADFEAVFFEYQIALRNNVLVIPVQGFRQLVDEKLAFDLAHG